MIYGKKRHKYNVADAADRTYGVDKDGEPVVYHSAAEASRAQELDWLLRMGVITSWGRQVTFRLGPVFVYVADFVVDGFTPDRRVAATWVEEVKGVKKPRDREVERFWAEYGPFPMLIYKRKGNAWVIERIEGAQTGDGDDGK